MKDGLWTPSLAPLGLGEGEGVTRSLQCARRDAAVCVRLGLPCTTADTIVHPLGLVRAQRGWGLAMKAESVCRLV